MEPIITSRGGRLYVYCPYCEEPIYNREEGSQAQFSCGIAFGLHSARCKKNPAYKETEMDAFMKRLGFAPE